MEGQKELERLRVQAEKEAAKKAAEEAKAKKAADSLSPQKDAGEKPSLLSPVKPAAPATAEKDIVDNLMGSLKQKDSNLILDEIRRRRMNQGAAPDISSNSLEKSIILFHF